MMDKRLFLFGLCLFMVFSLSLVGALEANAGGPYEIKEGEDLTLNASKSKGKNLVYNWTIEEEDIGKDNEIITLNWETLTDFGVSNDGQYDINLGVNNSEDGDAELIIKNSPPNIDIGGPYEIKEGEDLTLNASASDPSPEDEESLIYEWDLNEDDDYSDVKGANKKVSLETLKEHGIANNGTYKIKLRVNDDKGENITYTYFTVKSSKPSADASDSDKEIEVGDNLELDASESKWDGIDKIESYVWKYEGEEIYNVKEEKETAYWERLKDIGIDEEGTYLIELKVIDEDGDYDLDSFDLEVEENGSSSTTSNTEANTDTTSPQVNLLGPLSGDNVNKSNFEFSYDASDNEGLANCTIKLYSLVNASVSGSTLQYSSENLDEEVLDSNPLFGRNNLSFDGLDESIYSWRVDCYDNAGNSNWDEEYFIVNLSTKEKDYPKKEKVENLISSVNIFLDKEEDFKSKEKEVAKELSLIKDLEYYKKRLIDIDRSLSYELDRSAASEEVKESRREEYNKEIDEIGEEIPSDLEVVETKEYVKNSVDINLIEIVEAYMNSTNTQIGEREIESMAEANLDLQKYLTVEAKVWQVKIDYNGSTKEITLINKEIDVSNNSLDRILEVIPKDVVESTDEIDFLEGEEKIINKDPLIEFSNTDLEDGKISYVIDKFVGLDDIQKSQTILFSENVRAGGGILRGITGFFAFNPGEGNTLYYGLIVVMLMVLIYLSTFIYNKVKVKSWKREPNVVKAFELVSKAQRAIREQDLVRARENYHKIKQIYPLLPNKCKKHFYKKIKDLLTNIDKTDIFNLVREYEEAKREGRTREKKELYKDIKKIYKRLPPDSKSKIYKRVFNSA